MQSSGIVDLLDEDWQSTGDIREGFVTGEIDLLDLQGLHDAFGLGVIGIPDAAHRAEQTCSIQGIAIELGCVLAAPVRVMNASRRRLPARDG